MTKRGAACTVCTHKARHQIEIGLVHGVSARSLALRFKVSKDAIGRHQRAHLSPVQRAAILAAVKPSAVDLDALRTSESEGLLANVQAQRARLQQHVELAASLGDVRGCVAAESAITANLTLVAKLLGQLIQRHEVQHTNLLVSPDYLRLRAVLVEALKPFPDAARAVGAALHRLESDAAKDITEAARKRPVPIIDHTPQVPMPAPPY